MSRFVRFLFEMMRFSVLFDRGHCLSPGTVVVCASRCVLLGDGVRPTRSVAFEKEKAVRVRIGLGRKGGEQRYSGTPDLMLQNREASSLTNGSPSNLFLRQALRSRCAGHNQSAVLEGANQPAVAWV